MRKTGVNWAKYLPEYARTLSQEVKEELSWKCSFEVYHGRKPFRKDKMSGASTAQEWNIEGKRMSSAMFGSEVRKLIPQQSECVET